MGFPNAGPTGLKPQSASIPRRPSCSPPIRPGPSRLTDCNGIGSGSFARRRIASRSATERTGLARISTGKTILDAGCGMGRYLRIVGESPARLVVGVDLSRAVDAARELTRRPAPRRRAPERPPPAPLPAGQLRPHLLPGCDRPHADPRAAFLALARLLKPGGRIAIWVYPASVESWNGS